MTKIILKTDAVSVSGSKHAITLFGDFPLRIVPCLDNKFFNFGLIEGFNYNKVQSDI